jgi:hypothetical protein
VYGSRIVSGLAAVFAGMAALFLVLAFAYNLVFLVVAAAFGASAYFVWYHASGRFAQRLYEGVEDRAAADAGGGFGAEPREDWEPPRDGPQARAQAEAQGRGGRRAAREQARRAQAEGRRRQRTRRPPGSSDGPTAREAYDALGLSPSADEAAVKEAYREKVKEVHPDRPSGDEDEFKEVKAAYERLTD